MMCVCGGVFNFFPHNSSGLTFQQNVVAWTHFRLENGTQQSSCYISDRYNLFDNHFITVRTRSCRKFMFQLCLSAILFTVGPYVTTDYDAYGQSGDLAMQRPPPPLPPWDLTIQGWKPPGHVQTCSLCNPYLRR